MKAIKVEGLPELIKALKEFEKKVFNKVLKKAFREGSKVTQKAIKALTPKGESGLLKKAIKVRAMKRKKDRVGVSVTIGKGTFQGDSFYGGFLELGTKTKQGKVRIRKRQFMKRGFDNSKVAAANAMISSIRSGIATAAKEAAAKQAIKRAAA